MAKGFYKVWVEAPSMDYPVLPHKSATGKLIFPCGKWCGTYYSQELLLAKSHGYLLKPIEALTFSDSKAFLKDYVEHFTKIKAMGGARITQLVSCLLTHSMVVLALSKRTRLL